MKRWLRDVTGLILLAAGLAGCQKQCFLTEKDVCQSRSGLGLPAGFENDPQAAVTPAIHYLPPPPNVDFPVRPVRELSLREAIAIALENGTASTRNSGSVSGFANGGSGGGLVDDSMISFSPGSNPNLQSDNIRVLVHQPAQQAALMEGSLARFDALWVNSMNWSVTDNLQQGLASFSNGATANLSSSIVKAFATGGYANISFINNYQMLSNPPTGATQVINPQYTSQLQFGIEQPLWRNFGTDINRLLTRLAPISGVTMPTQAASAVNNQQTLALQTGQQTEGILLARLHYNQSRAEFERNVQALVLNVEVAYWRLYLAYGKLYSFEEVMRIAHKAWMVSHARFQAGKIGPGDYYPLRGQYEEFRGERMAALGEVLERERNLRGIMGLPVEDGTRLVPVTTPTLSPFQPNWEAALTDALNKRPELVIARDNVRLQQFNLITQKNFLKPDLRFVGLYSPIGIGTNLAGTGTFTDVTGLNHPSNAFRSLASDHFNNWTLGLTMTTPLGFRLESALVRATRLELARSYYLLKDQEERATRALTFNYQKVAEWYRLIETRRGERKAYGESVDARFREFVAGFFQPGQKTHVDFLLEAQRRLALAQVKEYEAIAEYNSTLARFEWARGNILVHDNIVIGEGPLPQCVEVRAVEHERQRTHALVLNQRPQPLTTPACLALDKKLPETLDPNAQPALQPHEVEELLRKGPLTPPEQLPPAAPTAPAVPSLPAGPTQGQDPIKSGPAAADDFGTPAVPAFTPPPTKLPETKNPPSENPAAIPTPPAFVPVSGKSPAAQKPAIEVKPVLGSQEWRSSDQDGKPKGEATAPQGEAAPTPKADAPIETPTSKAETPISGPPAMTEAPAVAPTPRVEAPAAAAVTDSGFAPPPAALPTSISEMAPPVSPPAAPDPVPVTPASFATEQPPLTPTPPPEPLPVPQATNALPVPPSALQDLLPAGPPILPQP